MGVICWGSDANSLTRDVRGESLWASCSAYRCSSCSCPWSGVWPKESYELFADNSGRRKHLLEIRLNVRLGRQHASSLGRDIRIRRDHQQARRAAALLYD